MTLTSAGEAWQEPTLGEAFVDGVSGRTPTPSPSKVPLRSTVGPFLAILLAAALIPDVRLIVADDGIAPLLGLVFAVPFAAVEGYRVQRRFGRSHRHGLAAVSGILIAMLMATVLFIGASIAIAHPPGTSPLDRALDALAPGIEWPPSTLIVVIVLVVLALLLVGAHPRMRRRRARHEARLAAAIEREQAARAAAATLRP
jgi:hypothetical protein